MPSLARDRLAGAYVYYDAQVDDARLTLTIARTAAAHGAAITNHAAVRGLVKDGDRVIGARVDADGQELEVRARVVVNAAGVWSDDVRALDEGTHPASIRPAKGIHIALPWERVRNDIAAIIPVPGDQRMVFVVPWGDTTYVGTTDTDYDGPLDDPPCTPDDVDYLLAAINGISEEKHTADDVVGTWAGLRPLLRTGRSTRTSDLSRRHTVRVAPSGVVTVTGGKLTTYRRMAADAVDAAVAGLGGNGGLGGMAVRQGRHAPSTCACSAARASPRPSPRWNRAPTNTSSAATAPKPTSCARSPSTIPTSRLRWCPGCRTSAPRRGTRCSTRWPARSTTCSHVAPARGSSRATRRPMPRRPSRRCSPPISGGPTPSATPRSRRTGRRSTPNARRIS